MLPFIVYPATCELCGDWLPEHKASCPRDGVHPSQWSITIEDDDEFAERLISSQEL
ncbi:hypothetical protein BDF21DRAFT_390614 [Thamnidium elegans]|uniref:Uncharacterized protein n=1 Tax=Thamnidium elegans TaxID=101142 RepID=A0A8H7SNF6_9FUNG|nr:hypothetical protein INT48_007635 [Thamnidium elegans]KAI8058829.1 hypothetical protein BDF21DRAFT_390614 [Thamnidium elegans]